VCEIRCSDECNLCPILTSTILFPPESHFPGFESPKHTKSRSEFNSRERERERERWRQKRWVVAGLSELVLAWNSESIASSLWSFHVFWNWFLSHWGFHMGPLYKSSRFQIVKTWWIHNCRSLQVFEILGCSSLTSLPEGMRSLTSLQRLTIWNSPYLLYRCKREAGEDWPKIAHIPKLELQHSNSGIDSAFYLNPLWKFKYTPSPSFSSFLSLSIPWLSNSS